MFLFDHNVNLACSVGRIFNNAYSAAPYSFRAIMKLDTILLLLVLGFIVFKLIFVAIGNKEPGYLKKVWASIANFRILAFFVILLALLSSYTSMDAGPVILVGILWTAYHKWLADRHFHFISWITLLLFWMHLAATSIGFPDKLEDELWYIILHCWGFSAFAVLVFELIGRKVKFAPAILLWVVCVLVALVPCMYMVHHYTYGVALGHDELFAIFQTDIREAMGFSNTYLPVVQLASMAIGALILMLALLQQQRTLHEQPLKFSRYLVLSLGLLLIIQLKVTERSSITALTVNTLEEYRAELALLRAERRKRKNTKVKAFKEDGKELTVVIIGESLNKEHMGLYGYHRNTTPILDSLYDAGKFIKYTEAFPTNTHTMKVLSMALTSANHANQLDPNASPSVLEVLNAADVETYWLTNQMPGGIWDNTVAVLSESADHIQSFNTYWGEDVKTSGLDGELTVALKEILSNGVEQNTAIFIHLMGNHGVYADRYDDAHERYTKDVERKNFGEKQRWSPHVNSYDNSVLYNDMVVSKILMTVQEAGGISSCIYLPDHSEDVLEVKGHSQHQFTYAMLQVPMLVAASEDYKLTYPERYKYLTEHADRAFSSDLLHDLVIGMAGVETSHYSMDLDPGTSAFNLQKKDCFSVDGLRPLTHPDNFYLHLRKSGQQLDSMGQSARVYPHRVNTLGKLANVLYNGTTGIELDVFFKENEHGKFFEVGHDNEAKAGMWLIEYLEKLKNRRIEKIWLDIKNLDEANVRQALARLEELNNMFGIKSTAIVESGCTDAVFSEMAAAGFHTSFYLPTWIKDKNTSEWLKLARQYANQLNGQKVSAVSFDAGLYPFVKDQLEPLLNSDVVYHTWDLSLEMADPKFKSILLTKAYFEDERVHSILARYRSNFEL